MSTLSPLTPKPSRVIFIDENYLKAITPINENVDPKTLISAIVVAQDKHILTILGSGIFEEMKLQLATSTLTSLNLDLLDIYVRPCLAWWSLVEALPNISMRIQNKGIEIKNSENSEAADIEEVLFLMQNYESTAKYYAQQLIMYLRRNNALYPLYYNPGGSYGSNIDTRYGLTTEYFSGLVMPQGNDCCGSDSIVGLGLGATVVWVPNSNHY